MTTTRHTHTPTTALAAIHNKLTELLARPDMDADGWANEVQAITRKSGPACQVFMAQERIERDTDEAASATEIYYRHTPDGGVQAFRRAPQEHPFTQEEDAIMHQLWKNGRGVS